MEQDYKYMVATRCFTYNHAQYIEDALRGFAMQETTFPAVYIIVDDASTDEEPKVLRKWVNENLQQTKGLETWKRVPYGQLCVATLKNKPLSTFVILLLDENHYAPEKKSLKFEYIAEWYDNAKYRALCEGDDYWSDPLKLQKQVFFLETHESVSLCFHPVKVVGEEIKITFPKRVGYSCVDDLCFGNYIATASVVCRNDKRIKDYEKKKIKYSRVGDFQTYMFYALIGDLYSFSEEMSVYRVHTENSWRGSDQYKKNKDYEGYLYNLINNKDMPRFPKFVLKIRSGINSIVLSERRALESDLSGNNNELNNAVGNKIKIRALLLAYHTLRVLETIKYRFLNIIK